MATRSKHHLIFNFTGRYCKTTFLSLLTVVIHRFIQFLPAKNKKCVTLSKLLISSTKNSLPDEAARARSPVTPESLIRPLTLAHNKNSGLICPFRCNHHPLSSFPHFMGLAFVVSDQTLSSVPRPVGRHRSAILSNEFRPSGICLN